MNTTFELSKNVNDSFLIKAGFKTNGDGCFTLHKNLYGNYVTLHALADVNDFSISFLINDEKNELYAPFYNPDENKNNLVAEEVVDNYNKFVRHLIKKKIITTEKKKINNEKKNSLPIKIKYFTDKIDKLKFIDGKSDWIDLRAAEDVSIKKGEFKLISLGVAIKLPKGYEAHIVPRSSTYKNWKILQTNSHAVIDESYCGDNDIWRYPVIAMEDTKINCNDRICQFRIVKKMPEIHFEEVDKLKGENRGGIGSTGRK